MQKEREELQAQIATLQAEAQLVKEQKQELEERNQELEEENQQLKSENHQLEERNQELIQQLKNVAVPDYEAMRSRILKSMTTGKGSFASTSPQYKSANRAMGKLIEDIKSASSDIASSTRTSTLAENTPDSQA